MHWLPFDLHPEYPPEGIPREQLNARYGQRMEQFLRARFAEEGLAYAPPPDVVPNSKAALRLAELARDHDVYEAAHERLMDAYWAESRDIGDPDVLRELAAEIGLEPGEVERVLAGDEHTARVDASTQQALAVGATGVPAWVIDGRVLISGAQPREVFERAFERAAERVGS